VSSNSRPGPGAAQKKFNAFFVKQSFFSSDLFMFWSLGYPGVGRVILVLRIFPDRVGVEVCAKCGEIGPEVRG